MNDFASNPLDQLRGRERSYEDLSRFIKTRAGETPNYTLLLGAGCSITSGVKSASTLVEEWRKDIYLGLGGDPQQYSAEAAKALLSERSTAWYNSQREYSSLFEKKFDLPRQRRMFVESEVSDAVPSLGYAYLVRLIEKGFLNTVFTTNFDDLLNEAFFRFSDVRPITCAHDSSIGSITVTSKRPKIIKLHGDYLFDDIKSTLPETESLEENTREKFIEFGRDFGLVVIGYSGCDRSVMDVLNHMLRRDDYLKNGIYWCIRKDDKPSDELLKLLWRDRVYFVRVDGFDELMAELHEDLIGPELPIDTSAVSEKPRNLIASFCENSALNSSPSPVVRRDLERLRKQNDREGLLNAFRSISDDETDQSKGSDSDSSLTDADLVKILAVKQLMSSGDAVGAREKISSLLQENPVGALRRELMLLRVRVEERDGERSNALAAIDELIECDHNEPSYYLTKAGLLTSHDERMLLVERAISIDEFRSSTWNRKIDLLVEQYKAAIGVNRAALLSEIDEAVKRTLTINPSIKNEAWWDAVSFYATANLSKEEIGERTGPLLRMSQEQDPHRALSLRARLKIITNEKGGKQSSAAAALLEDIRLSKTKRSLQEQSRYEWLELDALHELDRKDELSQKISALDVNPRFSNQTQFLTRKAEFLAKFSGDLLGAASDFEKALKGSFGNKLILRLAEIYSILRRPTDIDTLISKYSKQLDSFHKIWMERARATAAHEYDKALNLLRSSMQQRMPGVDAITAEVHDLLLSKRYPEAERVAKRALDSLNWDLHFGELIINYEIARMRGPESKLNKAKLGQLAEFSNREIVKACARYLLGDFEKAKKLLKEIFSEDKEDYYTCKEWAIFADPKGQAFLEQLKPL